MLAHVGVKDWLVRTAEGAGIPYQLEVLEGGTTDGRAIQTSRAGVPTGCVSVPTRYIHTPSEMVDLRGRAERRAPDRGRALGTDLDRLSAGPRGRAGPPARLQTRR